MYRLIDADIVLGTVIYIYTNIEMGVDIHRHHP